MTYKLSASYERMRGFYSLPKNTLHIIFIGTSHFFYGITPMKLWEDYGITSYVLAQQTQIMQCSYYYIKEALKYQSPKLIVLDVLSLLYWYWKPNISVIRKSIDYMKWGSNKLKLIEELINDEYMYEYFNNYLNHDTSKYVETTYEHLYNNDEFTTGDLYSIFMLEKFRRLRNSIYRMTERPQNVEGLDNTCEISPELKGYLRNIVKNLRGRNIDVCCINMPFFVQPILWAQFRDLDEVLRNEGVNFLDFNRYHDAGINLKTDFSEGEHLNYWGAKKVTQYVGKYIMDSYKDKFEDKRDNPYYKVWNDYNIKYQESNESIMRELLNNTIARKAIEKISNYEFMEDFDEYVKNHIDIKEVYSKDADDDSDIDINLTKVEDEESYYAMLNYKVKDNDYVVLRRMFISDKIKDWSNNKGLEIEMLPDNSNRDLIIRIRDRDGLYFMAKVMLTGNKTEKIKILLDHFQDIRNGGNMLHCTDINTFEIGISTKCHGEKGHGCVVIKSIKLF